ncbi:hypothetical protein NC651_005452 [Populus alba x Populus x berolinensis]|nr:hypothetical protein NC651_005452 [Populus alba x Populus x berolinensis]
MGSNFCDIQDLLSLLQTLEFLATRSLSGVSTGRVGEVLHPEYSRPDYQLEKIAEWPPRYWSSLQLFNSSRAARLQERWAPSNSTKGWRSFSSHSTNSGPSLTLMQVRTWHLVMHVSGLYMDLIPTNTQTPYKKFLALGPWWIVSVESYAFSVFTGKRRCLLINKEN